MSGTPRGPFPPEAMVRRAPDEKPVPVVWWSNHEGILDRGYWDQAIIEAAMDGTLWPPARTPRWEHHNGFRTVPVPTEGGVVVVPARWHATSDDYDTLNRELSRWPWVLLILTGDEESTFHVERLSRHRRMRVWRQTPANTDGIDYPFGDGWRPDTRAILAKLGDRPGRVNQWWWAGQVNTKRREELAGALSRRRARRADGTYTATGGFGQGEQYDRYCVGLATAKVVPCPGGTFTPDTFRLFEALEAGCVPVTEEDPYWAATFGGTPPWPTVRSWEQFGDTVDTVMADWPRHAAAAGAWWVERKRELARRLTADIEQLRRAAAPERHAGDAITVLMPTSPIPDHPETAIIEETISSIRERLPTAEIIIMCDGVRAEQHDRTGAYREYLRRVVQKAQQQWPGVLPVMFEEHLHQAEMTHRTLSRVTTPTILFVEHDTPLVGEVEWDGLVAAVRGGGVNVARLHHESRVLPDHRHMMLGNGPVKVEGVDLWPTAQWSQRPHLASTEFYRTMIGTYFGRRARTMIEDTMHGVLHTHYEEQGRAGWDRFRVYLYTPAGGSIQRSTHSDGRGGDPKFGMVWRYDTDEVPMGAPNPHRDEDEEGDQPPPRVAVREGRRLGVWGARGDRRGLAVQTTEFCRHLHPERIFGIDMGPQSPYRPDWGDYPPERLTVGEKGTVTPEQARAWLDGLDVVLGAETFYFEWFTRECERAGVRTVLHYNHEFSGHVKAHDWAPAPTVMAAPTTWHLADTPGAVHLPMGVDRTRLPYRLRTEARTFLHVAGHPAARDRAGTQILLDALRYVTQPMRVIIRSQQPMRMTTSHGRHVELEWKVGDEPDYWRLYDEGDVLVLPRRYGGQCLPMNEAMSVGMPVLMPDGEPQRATLPEGMLVRPRTVGSMNTMGGAVETYETDPQGLARAMDRLAAHPDEVERLSKEADAIAEAAAWPTVMREWERVLYGQG